MEVVEKQVESIFKKISFLGVVEGIDLLSGDASHRSYYRVKFRFQMKMEDKAQSQTYIYSIDRGEGVKVRAEFFSSIAFILTKGGVLVPEIYYQDTTSGEFLLEDLGDKTSLLALASLKSQDDEYEAFRKIIDELIKIHRIEEKTPLAFDYEKLFFEVEFSVKYFLKKHLISMSVGDEKKFEHESELLEGFSFICKELASQKRVYTHRDFHSRNIMAHQKGDKEFLYVIDFQDARMGIPQYDLVSLLEDCYYRPLPQNKENLKKYYWDHFLGKINFQKDYREFEYYYDLMSIQRIFKAIGSFAYIYASKNDIRYLRYIGYAFENLRSFLFKYPKFDRIREILSTMYYGT